MSEVCQNGRLFLVTEHYIKGAEGDCQKSTDKRELPELSASIVYSLLFHSRNHFHSSSSFRETGLITALT